MKLEQLLAIMQRDSKGNHALHFQPLFGMKDLSEKRLRTDSTERLAEKLPSHVTGDKAEIVERLHDQQIRDMCISSWCMCSYQSAAMWPLYAGPRGVAIESTIRNLQQCFADLRDFPMGVTIERVRYYPDAQAKEYSKEQVWGSHSIKWQSYECEHELRAAVICREDEGADVPIDPTVLISRLWVSPEAEAWVVRVALNAVRQYGFDFSVDKASLGELR
jgi:hypothetical protein